MRTNENKGLDIFENQRESILTLFENNQELMKIIKNQQESMRIYGLDIFENQH